MLRVRRLPRQDARPHGQPSPFYFRAIGHACAIARADGDARAVDVCAIVSADDDARADLRK